jgi:hypothetical protein
MCMGTLIRYINNRDLAVENIVKSLIRLQVVLGSPGGTVLAMASHLESRGFAWSKTSL